MLYPTIGKYNQAIISNNGSCLVNLSNFTFEAARNSPFKVFSFGSGANAVVFKIRREGNIFGLRCFLNDSSSRIDRAKIISKHLSQVNSFWKIDYQFLESEIVVESIPYPVILMSWSSGRDLNSWVGLNLGQSHRLSNLQERLMEMLLDLESNNIGHGDIQCGNILIEDNGAKIVLKLIDYDGMYVPALSHLNSIENGRPEFQHPKRRLTHFAPRIDRFPILIMITALEILKYDQSFWQSPLLNGFNSLDNLLFSSKDFSNVKTSKLFLRARSLNSASINFYLDQIEKALGTEVLDVTLPKLYKGQISTESEERIGDSNLKVDEILITSNVPAAVIFGIKSIGTTPLKISKSLYSQKELIVSNGKGKLKRVCFSSNDNSIHVEL